MELRAILAAAFFLTLVVTACSSTGRGGGRNEHAIQRVFVDKLRVRRPSGQGADPKAGPGGIDYRSDPLPNERLDCETLADLFKELDLAGVRACLAQLGGTTAPVAYRLRRDTQPYFELERPDDAPECLRLRLPRLPVPREIVFQSSEKGRYACYSARLDMEANQIWGELRLPTARVSIPLKFPLEKVPTNDDETVRLLAAWALTPIWGEVPGKARRVVAKIVPDRLCRRCLGDKDFLREGDLGHLLWP